MKNLLKVLLALFIVFSFVGCAAPEEEKEGVKVALLIPFRGDQSYFDVIANGMALIEAEIEDAETTIIEMGRDQSKWENYYLDAAEGDYDIIIGGNWEASPTFEKVIAQFPDKKFINFDWDVAPTNANTYGMFYKANELGYLTGLVAGLDRKSVV